MTTDRDAAIARQLAGYDEMAAHLQMIIDGPPAPRIRRGKVVLGKDGKPVPNLGPKREAERLLARVQRDRARLAAQLPAQATPPAGDDPGD